MRNVFIGFAVGLFVAAVLLATGQPQYFNSVTGNVPNNVIGLLTCGLAIAGGLALIAAALYRSPDNRP